MTPSMNLTVEKVQNARQALGQAGPIHMLNLLRYRDVANYSGSGDLPPVSGRDAYYQRYVPAFQKLGDPAGVHLTWLGKVHAALVAPDGEMWDDVAIVEYPSFEAFARIVLSDEYAAQADPHRLAALADWRLIATSKRSLPTGGLAS